MEITHTGLDCPPALRTNASDIDVADFLLHRRYNHPETPLRNLGTPEPHKRIDNPNLFGATETFLRADLLEADIQNKLTHLHGGTNIPEGILFPFLVPNTLASWETALPDPDNALRHRIFSDRYQICDLQECNQYLYDLEVTLDRTQRVALSQVLSWVARAMRTLVTSTDATQLPSGEDIIPPPTLPEVLGNDPLTIYHYEYDETDIRRQNAAMRLRLDHLTGILLHELSFGTHLRQAIEPLRDSEAFRELDVLFETHPSSDKFATILKGRQTVIDINDLWELYDEAHVQASSINFTDSALLEAVREINVSRLHTGQLTELPAHIMLQVQAVIDANKTVYFQAIEALRKDVNPDDKHLPHWYASKAFIEGNMQILAYKEIVPELMRQEFTRMECLVEIFAGFAERFGLIPPPNEILTPVLHHYEQHRLDRDLMKCQNLMWQFHIRSFLQGTTLRGQAWVNPEWTEKFLQTRFFDMESPLFHTWGNMTNWWSSPDINIRWEWDESSGWIVRKDALSKDRTANADRLDQRMANFPRIPSSEDSDSLPTSDIMPVLLPSSEPSSEDDNNSSAPRHTTPPSHLTPRAWETVAIPLAGTPQTVQLYVTNGREMITEDAIPQQEAPTIPPTHYNPEFGSLNFGYWDNFGDWVEFIRPVGSPPHET